MFADIFKKLKWGDIWIVVGLLVISATVFLFPAPRTTVAVVEQNGKVIHTLDLKDPESEGRQIKVEGNYTNLLEITDAGISVVSADCPDGVCMQGVVGKTTRMIACLPNRLMVYLPQEKTEVDVILQ